MGALLITLAWAGTRTASADDTDPAIATLLDQAEAAEREDHLIYPARGSAMSIYHEILFQEPDNAYALEGLTRLAEHFLEQAQAALNERQLIKADSLVSKARMVYPDYPGVQMMDRQLKLVENARRARQTLDWRRVADRDPGLGKELKRLGAAAKRDDCRVTIQVSNDAEGRWVYRHMNEASGPRLRAEIEIASPAAVETLCFESAQIRAIMAQEEAEPGTDEGDG